MPSVSPACLKVAVVRRGSCLRPRDRLILTFHALDIVQAALLFFGLITEPTALLLLGLLVQRIFMLVKTFHIVLQGLN